MIGEERQASFKAQYQQFDITLRMSSEDALSIAVENTQTLERYRRNINQEYISHQDASFQRIFGEAKHIYDYLKAVINQVVVDGQFLVFNYRHRNNRVKRIKIQLIREDIDRVELANRKAGKAMTKELAESLRANSEKLETEIYSTLLVPVKQISKQIDLQKFQEVKAFQKVDHHPNNAHKEYFALTNLTGTSARITRIGDNGDYNFVNKCEVLPNQKARYLLTINQTKDSCILVGFCTEKGLGNIANWTHAESAYNFCWGPGYLYQGGSEQKTGVGAVEGETVECVADLASRTLSWWKEGIKFVECAVPAGMRNKPIYISIILCHIGEEVDLYL